MKKVLIGLFIILGIWAVLNIIFYLENKYGDIKTISINKPIELSYKSKEEIFKIRKFYASHSIFAGEDYQPSQEVFGGIEDFKPWLRADVCFEYDPKHPDDWSLKIGGPSDHSRSLINPSLLVFIDYPFCIPEISPDKEMCPKINKTALPVKAIYSKSRKELELTYNKLPALSDRSAYQVTAINARDFGYRYMYLDKDKSTLNLKYITDDNISTSVKEITDFIHTGGACRVEGGCNNWSIARRDLQFQPIYGDNTSEKPQLYIKLWKNRPASSSDNADLGVKFIFLDK